MISKRASSRHSNPTQTVSYRAPRSLKRVGKEVSPQARRDDHCSGLGPPHQGLYLHEGYQGWWGLACPHLCGWMLVVHPACIQLASMFCAPGQEPHKHKAKPKACDTTECCWLFAYSHMCKHQCVPLQAHKS